MLTPRSTLTRRIVAALDATPSRIPVLVGGCGSGRTTLLHQLRDRLGRTSAQSHRRRAHGHDARTFSARRRGHRAVSDQRRGAGGRPRRLRRDARVFRARADGGRRAGDVPARRVPRAADVRKLSGPAARASRVHRQPGVERQPVRADQPVRRPDAAAAPRRVVSLRSHSCAATYGRRCPRHPGPRGAAGAAGRRVRRADRAGLVRRAARLRPRARRRAGRDARARRRQPRRTGHRRSDQRARGAPVAGRTARAAVRLLLRAAVAPRTRLRRVEGHPRDPCRGRRADADGDLSPPAPHTGIDQGLPIVARGRGSRHVAAKAVQLHRSAAPRLGAAALPGVGADRRRSGARGPSLRAPASAAAAAEPALAMAAAGGGSSEEDRKAWGIIEID